MATSTTKKTTGKDLVPDLAKLTASVANEYWFWIGALPGCPQEHLDVGGIDFPKMTEDVSQDPRRRNKTRRIPQIGSVRKLSLAKIERIKAALPFLVIRFDKDEPNPGGAGDKIDVLDLDRRKGHPIRIPTPTELKQAKENGKHMREYVADPRDEPGARYVFMKLCENQQRGERDDVYPEPLEVTGIEWPE